MQTSNRLVSLRSDHELLLCRAQTVAAAGALVLLMATGVTAWTFLALGLAGVIKTVRVLRFGWGVSRPPSPQAGQEPSGPVARRI